MGGDIVRKTERHNSTVFNQTLAAEVELKSESTEDSSHGQVPVKLKALPNE